MMFISMPDAFALWNQYSQRAPKSQRSTWKSHPDSLHCQTGLTE